MSLLKLGFVVLPTQPTENLLSRIVEEPWQIKRSTEPHFYFTK
jgi:hypothetical protein